jgi:hypothetical protein
MAIRISAVVRQNSMEKPKRNGSRLPAVDYRKVTADGRFDRSLIAWSNWKSSMRFRT